MFSTVTTTDLCQIGGGWKYFFFFSIAKVDKAKVFLPQNVISFPFRKVKVHLIRCLKKKWYSKKKKKTNKIQQQKRNNNDKCFNFLNLYFFISNLFVRVNWKPLWSDFHKTFFTTNIIYLRLFLFLFSFQVLIQEDRWFELDINLIPQPNKAITHSFYSEKKI